MTEKPTQQEFFVQDPFTEEVKGPLSASDLKQWFSKGGFDAWGVSKSPNGPWTIASQVKGLIRQPPAALPESDTAIKSTVPRDASLDGSGSSDNSKAVAASKPSAAFGSLPIGQSSAQSDLFDWLRRNPFALMIAGGCVLLALGVASDNPVFGGIGFWTAVAGAVAPRLRSKFPKVFASATPLSVGAVLALVIGSVLLLSSVAADTTVDSGTSFGRVHNIGLMNQQRNGMTVGAILMAAGVAMGGLHLHNKRGANTVSVDDENKSCPKCGEAVKRVAVFCKHCKSDI